jgi:hypothetical protein
VGWGGVLAGHTRRSTSFPCEGCNGAGVITGGVPQVMMPLCI